MSGTNAHRNACLKNLDEHLRAENDHHLDDIMATYGLNPVVNINGQLFEGMDKVRFFHDRFGFGGNGSFSEVHVIEKKRRTCEDSVVIEQELNGLHTGVWQKHEPTGKKFTIPVCTIYSFGPNGELSREDVYFDSLALLKQLGLS